MISTSSWKLQEKHIYTQHQNHIFVKSTKSSHKVAFNDIVCLTGQPHWVRAVVSFWLNIWWHSTSEHTPGNWTLHGQCRVRSRKAGSKKSCEPALCIITIEPSHNYLKTYSQHLSIWFVLSKNVRWKVFQEKMMKAIKFFKTQIETPVYQSKGKWVSVWNERWWSY